MATRVRIPAGIDGGSHVGYTVGKRQVYLVLQEIPADRVVESAGLAAQIQYDRDKFGHDLWPGFEVMD